MTPAWAWKEYREHRLVWLAMALFGALALVCSASLLRPGVLVAGTREADLLIAIAVVLSWAYGVVCGAMLLAGEREDGTLNFLDAMPRLRRQLWNAKCLTGMALIAAQAVVLLAALLYLRVADGLVPLLIQGIVLLMAAVVGLGWGMLFSAGGSTVLQVIGQAIGGQILTGFGLLVLVFLVELAVTPTTMEESSLAYLVVSAGLVVLTALSFAGSARVFSHTDLLRQRAAVEGAASAQGTGWGVLTWLTWQQTRGMIVVTGLSCLAAGWACLVAGAWLWPWLTLVLGIACGATAFADEQLSGANRFLGEQRFEPGRVWLVKTLMRLALALAGTFLLLLPAIIRLGLNQISDVGNSQRFRPELTGLFGDELLGTVAAPLPYLLLWLLHGFALGELCGLLFRKGLVACVLAFGLSLTLVSVWLPSLVGGGLHLWQVAGVPLLALIAAGLIFPAWTSGRLVSGRTAVQLTGVAMVMALWTAGALAWRVLEVPPPPDTLGLPAFLASLPQLGENHAGEGIRRATEELNGRLRELPQAPVPPVAQGRRSTRDEEPFLQQATRALTEGWPRGNVELEAWMGQIFTGPWQRDLERAVRQPLGVVEDPRRLNFESRSDLLQQLQNVGSLLAAHGLWRQAAGEPAAFPKDLATGLALSRQLRHDAIPFSARDGREVQALLLEGMDRWLERLDGRPDLLRQGLTELLRHEKECPDDGLDTVRAELVVALNALDHPEDFLNRLANGGRNVRTVSPTAAAVGLAWQIPWEHLRQERLLLWVYTVGAQKAPTAWRTAPWQQFVAFGPPNHTSLRQQALARLRAAQVVLALRLYQAQTGQLPESLSDLVPHYLPALPADPFDPEGRPLRYRRSRGETLTPSGGTARQVPAGQGLVWSVGPDGRDTNGAPQRTTNEGSNQGGDLLFVVPWPPR